VTKGIEQLFRETRAQSLAFCEPLNVDDYGLQAEVFTSPPKWHLAHTTWFFETFLLKPYLDDYSSPEPLYEVMFNSYYNGVGDQHPRGKRGLLSRPTVAEVRSYRESVDSSMQELLRREDHPRRREILQRTELGVEHERQHQELFFTDLKYSLAENPMLPTYLAREDAAVSPAPDLEWLHYEGGLVETGYCGEGFCFDNELPRHRSWLEPFELASRLVTNGEYGAFIADGGYRRPELWLSDGWDAVRTGGWRGPPYWIERGGESLEYTLHGLRARQSSAPVCHLSGYEADAFARWAGARLPTEQEWETAAASAALPTGCVDAGVYHPRTAKGSGLQQLYGDCWQWTQSAYSPYPGYRPAAGAIGEYNGKFMSNQWVLRGGSCVSKAGQLRPSYRNFFYPGDRWQFSGIRLARSGDTE
jgi:ergothioneine biosynthesis protein EgtB